MHATRNHLPLLHLLAVTALVAPLAILSLARTTSAQAGQPASLLADTFRAHGGLDRFREQRQLAYTMNGFPLSEPMSRPNRSTVDLRTRRNRIDGDGFTVGFDGDHAWSSPGPDAVGLPSRFVTLGSFYFIGMPFVFGDDGVVLRDAGTGSFRGRTYDVIEVSYERGTGHTSEDDYTVFVDPDTKRIALIHHSVTENPDVSRVTWTFDDWQEIDGLLIPARMTFYVGWNPDEPGDGASFTIEDAEFSAQAPASSLYRALADAVVDDSPATH